MAVNPHPDPTTAHPQPGFLLETARESIRRSLEEQAAATDRLVQVLQTRERDRQRLEQSVAHILQREQAAPDLSRTPAAADQDDQQWEARLAAKDREIDDLKSLRSTLREQDDMIRSLRRMLAIKEESLADLIGALEQQDGEIRRIQQALQDKEAEMSRRSELLDRQGQTVRLLQKEISLLERRVRQADDLERQLHAVEAECQAARHALARKEQDSQLIRTEIAALLEGQPAAAALAAKEEKQRQIEGEMALAQERVAQLEEDLDASRRAVDDLARLGQALLKKDRQLHELQAEATGQQAQLRELEQSRDLLKLDLGSNRSQLMQLQREHEKLLARLAAGGGQEGALLAERLRHLQEENLDLRQRVGEKERELAASPAFDWPALVADPAEAAQLHAALQAGQLPGPRWDAALLQQAGLLAGPARPDEQPDAAGSPKLRPPRHVQPAAAEIPSSPEPPRPEQELGAASPAAPEDAPGHEDWRRTLRRFRPRRVSAASLPLEGPSLAAPAPPEVLSIDAGLIQEQDAELLQLKEKVDSLERSLRQVPGAGRGAAGPAADDSPSELGREIKELLARQARETETLQAQLQECRHGGELAIAHLQLQLTQAPDDAAAQRLEAQLVQEEQARAEALERLRLALQRLFMQHSEQVHLLRDNLRRRAAELQRVTQALQGIQTEVDNVEGSLGQAAPANELHQVIQGRERQIEQEVQDLLAELQRPVVLPPETAAASAGAGDLVEAAAAPTGAGDPAPPAPEPRSVEQTLHALQEMLAALPADEAAAADLADLDPAAEIPIVAKPTLWERMRTAFKRGESSAETRDVGPLAGEWEALPGAIAGEELPQPGEQVHPRQEQAALPGAITGESLLQHSEQVHQLQEDVQRQLAELNQAMQEIQASGESAAAGSAPVADVDELRRAIRAREQLVEQLAAQEPSRVVPPATPSLFVPSSRGKLRTSTETAPEIAPEPAPKPSLFGRLLARFKRNEPALPLAADEPLATAAAAGPAAAAPAIPTPLKTIYFVSAAPLAAEWQEVVDRFLAQQRIAAVWRTLRLGPTDSELAAGEAVIYLYAWQEWDPQDALEARAAEQGLAYHQWPLRNPARLLIDILDHLIGYIEEPELPPEQPVAPPPAAEAVPLFVTPPPAPVPVATAAAPVVPEPVPPVAIITDLPPAGAALPAEPLAAPVFEAAPLAPATAEAAALPDQQARLEPAHAPTEPLVAAPADAPAAAEPAVVEATAATEEIPEALWGDAVPAEEAVVEAEFMPLFEDATAWGEPSLAPPPAAAAPGEWGTPPPAEAALTSDWGPPAAAPIDELAWSMPHVEEPAAAAPVDELAAWSMPPVEAAPAPAADLGAWGGTAFAEAPVAAPTDDLGAWGAPAAAAPTIDAGAWAEPTAAAALDDWGAPAAAPVDELAAWSMPPVEEAPAPAADLGAWGEPTVAPAPATDELAAWSAPAAATPTIDVGAWAAPSVAAVPAAEALGDWGTPTAAPIDELAAWSMPHPEEAPAPADDLGAWGGTPLAEAPVAASTDDLGDWGAPTMAAEASVAIPTDDLGAWGEPAVAPAPATDELAAWGAPAAAAPTIDASAWAEPPAATVPAAEALGDWGTPAAAPVDELAAWSTPPVGEAPAPAADLEAWGEPAVAQAPATDDLAAWGAPAMAVEAPGGQGDAWGKPAGAAVPADVLEDWGAPTMAEEAPAGEEGPWAEPTLADVTQDEWSAPYAPNVAAVPADEPPLARPAVMPVDDLGDWGAPTMAPEVPIAGGDAWGEPTLATPVPASDPLGEWGEPTLAPEVPEMAADAWGAPALAETMPIADAPYVPVDEGLGTWGEPAVPDHEEGLGTWGEPVTPHPEDAPWGQHPAPHAPAPEYLNTWDQSSSLLAPPTTPAAHAGAASVDDMLAAWETPSLDDVFAGQESPPPTKADTPAEDFSIEGWGE